MIRADVPGFQVVLPRLLYCTCWSLAGGRKGSSFISMNLYPRSLVLVGLLPLDKRAFLTKPKGSGFSPVRDKVFAG